RRSIDAAFTKLIADKGTEAVTIHDIAEEALINRGTFCMHYADKNDLLDSYESALLEGLYAILSRSIEAGDQTLSIVMPRRIATETFNYIDENADKIIALFNKIGRAHV